MIKFIVPLLAIAISLPGRADRVGGNAKSEASIRKLISDFSKARNALDWDALSKMYAEDSEYILPGQAPVLGRVSVKKAWDRVYGRADRSIRDLKFIKPDVALVQADVRVFSDGGGAPVDFIDRFVIAKRHRGWEIVVHETNLPAVQPLFRTSAPVPVNFKPLNVDFRKGEIGRIPPGWNVPQAVLDAGYTAELSREDCPGGSKRCVFFQPPSKLTPVFAEELQQTFPATPYLGKQVRFQALLRTKDDGRGDVEIRMRIDHADGRREFFDSVNGPVGSAAPQRREVKGVVGPDAVSISIWARYHPWGPAWMARPSFGIVE